MWLVATILKQCSFTKIISPFRSTWIRNGFSQKPVLKKKKKKASSWVRKVAPCLGVRKEFTSGTSLLVQWLRLCISNAGDTISIPGQRTKIHIKECTSITWVPWRYIMPLSNYRLSSLKLAVVEEFTLLPSATATNQACQPLPSPPLESWVIELWPAYHCVYANLMSQTYWIALEQSESIGTQREKGKAIN